MCEGASSSVAGVSIRIMTSHFVALYGLWWKADDVIITGKLFVTNNERFLHQQMLVGLCYWSYVVHVELFKIIPQRNIGILIHLSDCLKSTVRAIPSAIHNSNGQTNITCHREQSTLPLISCINKQ